jgi:glycine oxidase
LVSQGPAVLVAGAGAFGSAIALELARAGLRVSLADPAPRGDNASGVAAGMLAPAFEALLDPVEAGRFEFLRAARDLWPGFAGEVAPAIDLRRDGALWRALPGEAPELIERYAAGFAAMGAAVELRPEGLFTPEDWRLAPGPALAALHAAAEARGVVRISASVTAFEPGWAWLSTGDSLAADVLVVATGAESAELAPELAALAPIKGQILHFGVPHPAGAPVIRCEAGYLAGGADGVCVGATMEPGRADRIIEPATVERLRALAMILAPDLGEAAFTPLAGVRAASPDGLPLVGPSALPGVVLAVGARRNGWLFAPMVARLVAAHLTGRDPGPHAGAMDARRFSAD